MADNRSIRLEEFRSSGRPGRVSIYLNTNGASFLPAAVPPDESFRSALLLLRDALGVTEVHLTGGEPTLHPKLPELVGLVRRAGFAVCMTSNGENGAQVLPAAARAGLDRVNFSIFGTTSEELAQVQHSRFANSRLAARKIQALHASVLSAIAHGMRVNANIVVPDYSHAPRVRRLLDEWSPCLNVRLLNSLDDGEASVKAIEEILRELHAVPEIRHVTAGASGFRTAYRLPDGRRVYFKQIGRTRLPVTCASCRFNNDRDCQEGYYGVRLYRAADGRYMVGVCIQRMDLCRPVEEFVGSPLCAEIVELREHEYRRATRQAG